ncbi:acetyltransferase [Nitzschia inconspicua]|uniref:Acetyltransferase n=1 Tax=Nitzschia inconspicua TaxID=303405 RepID=A0A9K3LL87_9STRA|nr:acetyltransferase [Nitzschia inconspicua]
MPESNIPASDGKDLPETVGHDFQPKAAMVDITTMLKDAASALTFESPMIHTDSFNLQDSMAALEIMDQKMDCCEVPASAMLIEPTEQQNDKDERMIFPRPAPTGLDDVIDALPWDELTIEDAAFIALENVIRLESLLSGSSVVESTYTCLYSHKVVLEDMHKRLDPCMSLTEQMKAIMQTPTQKGTMAQRSVFASTLLLVELTDLVRGVILNADIYEEEDFGTSTFNIASFRRPSEGFTLKIVLDEISSIEEESTKLDQYDNQDALEAIRLTLSFQKDLMVAVSSLARLSGKTIRKEVEAAQQSIKSAKKKLQDSVPIFARLKEKQSDSVKVILRRTFDPFVNRPLVGNSPVRTIVFRDAIDATNEMIRMVDEVDWCVCKVILKANSLGRIRRMMRPVSSESANILTRSLLVLNLYFDELIFGQYSLPEMIVRYMRQLSHVPDSIVNLPTTDAFLNRLCKPVYDTLKLMALNRNRQRSYLDIMLGDWSALREEAYIADMTNHQDSGSHSELQPHFSVYVISTTIELMDNYVDLGVELELLCNEHELTIAYWYRDFLLSSLLTQLNTMRRYKLDAKKQVHQDAEQFPATVSGGKPQKGGKKKGKNKVSVSNGASNRTNRDDLSITPTVEDIEEEVEYLFLNAKRFLCRGIVRFFVSLNQAGLIKENSFDFTSNEIIYQKRFEPFIDIHQPPYLTYDDYLKGSDFTKLTQNNLVSASSDSFGVAKSLIDQALKHMSKLDPDFLPIQVEEVKQLSKVCVANSVYLQRLKQLTVGGKTNAKLTLDMATHKHFCTIKLG